MEKKKKPMSLYIVQILNIVLAIFLTWSQPESPWWFFIAVPAAGWGLGYISLVADKLMKLFYPPVMLATHPKATYLFFTFLMKYVLPLFLTVMVFFALFATLVESI